MNIYNELNERSALLKLLELSRQGVAENGTRPAREVLQELRAKADRNWKSDQP